MQTAEGRLVHSLERLEDSAAPAVKRQRTSLFASYDRRRSQPTESSSTLPLRSVILNYVDTVAALIHSPDARRWAQIKTQKQFEPIYPLLEEVFSVPATSAPVERVFHHGGLFMRPHRARMSDRTLSDLVFIKCNK